MAKQRDPMPSQRDANQPAGIQSGTSVKQKITEENVVPNSQSSARPRRQTDTTIRGGFKLRR